MSILVLEWCWVGSATPFLPPAAVDRIGFGQPIATASAYCLLAILMGGFPVSPADRKCRAAIRSLAVAIACSVALQAPGRLAAAWGAVALAAWSVAGILLIRNAAMDLVQRFPSAWPAPRRALVVGGGSWAHEFIRSNRLAGSRAAFDIMAIVDDRDGPVSLDAHAARIVDASVTDVFVALPWSAAERIHAVLAALRFLPVTVRLAPEHVPPFEFAALGVLQVSAMPTLSRPPFSASGLAVKRTLDVVGAAILLVLLAPLFAVVSLLVRLDSPGPVLFRQSRMGQFGRGFVMYKFRSLHVAHSDTAAERLVCHGDQRVTRIGRYLRKYSLDELPQLLNVLAGSMSLVGPRPHASRAKADGRLYAEVRPDYLLRYRVKPGMTGWAQVNGWRGNTDTAEKLLKRVEFDFDYIRRWSLMLDVAILLRTIPSVLMPPPENA